MDRWEISGRTLEYDDDTHTYLVDGIIVPSVTKLLAEKFNKKYVNVDADTLRKAAERGTMIHKAIEDSCKYEDIELIPEVRDFRFLLKKYKYEVESNEIPVLFDLGGFTYAGRMDLVLKNDSGYAVADIKTTAVLDKEYLGYQLNLYRIGLEQSYGIKADKLFGVHLRDGKRRMVEIPIKEEQWLVESLISVEV